MKKMLFITAFPPNRLTAGQNYSKELLNNLSRKFDTDLICFSYPNHKVEVDPAINLVKNYQTTQWNKLLGWLCMPLFHPFFVLRFRIDLLVYLIRNARKYQVVYFDFSQVFVYALFVKSASKVMMCHDVILQKIKRNKWYYLNPLNVLLFFTEKTLLKSADLILCFSQKDQQLIKDNYQLAASVVSFFISENIKQINYSELTIQNKFSLFGAWNRPENMNGLWWFYKNVLPYVNKAIKFEIIGPSIDESFKASIQDNPQIIYLGFLDNPYLEIASSKGLIAPLFQGAGVKVKVVESLATGTKVLGTSVAFEGIDEMGNQMMQLCESANDFINAINSFSSTTNEQKSIMKNLFEQSYLENNCLNILENTLSIKK